MASLSAKMCGKKVEDTTTINSYEDAKQAGKISQMLYHKLGTSEAVRREQE